MLAFVIRPCAFPNIRPHIIWRGHHINLLIWTLEFIWHKGPVHQCYLANILRQYKQRRVMMTFCKRVYNWLFGNSVVYELINDERHGVLCKQPYPLFSYTITANKTINETDTYCCIERIMRALWMFYQQFYQFLFVIKRRSLFYRKLLGLQDLGALFYSTLKSTKQFSCIGLTVGWLCPALAHTQNFLFPRNLAGGLLRFSGLQTKEGQTRREFHIVGFENS